MSLNFPIDLNNIDELSEEEQDKIMEIMDKIRNHSDTEVKEDYEETWDGDRHCKRLTDRWEINKTLGYQIHTHREYRFPITAKNFGALESSSRILDVI